MYCWAYRYKYCNQVDDVTAFHHSYLLKDYYQSAWSRETPRDSDGYISSRMNSWILLHHFTVRGANLTLWYSRTKNYTPGKLLLTQWVRQSLQSVNEQSIVTAALKWYDAFFESTFSRNIFQFIPLSLSEFLYSKLLIAHQPTNYKPTRLIVNVIGVVNQEKRYSENWVPKIR